MKKLQIKVDKFMDKDKISYSGILDCIKYINMLNGKKKNEYEYKLITFVLKISKKNEINEKILNELIKYFSIKFL